MRCTSITVLASAMAFAVTLASATLLSTQRANAAGAAAPASTRAAVHKTSAAKKVQQPWCQRAWRTSSKHR